MAERAASVLPDCSGSSGPEPFTISRLGSTPRFFTIVKTTPARAMLSDRLKVPRPVSSECPVKVTRVLTRSNAESEASSFSSAAS